MMRRSVRVAHHRSLEPPDGVGHGRFALDDGPATGEDGYDGSRDGVRVRIDLGRVARLGLLGARSKVGGSWGSKEAVARFVVIQTSHGRRGVESSPEALRRSMGKGLGVGSAGLGAKRSGVLGAVVLLQL